MKSRRNVIPIVALLLASLAAAPALASPGPLLSGYGGPGQGSQAILGATLLNGPSNGGGGGSVGSAQAAAGPAPGIAGASPQGGAASQSARHRHAAARNGQQARTVGGTASEGSRSSYQRYLPAGASRLSAGDSGMLGLSASHVLFMLLALAALLFAGLLTRGLAQGGTRGHAGN